MDSVSSPVIYGVLGFPAKHSLSPLMHNRAFSALGIPAEYRIFEKSPEELKFFLTSLAEEHIRGLNVTIPYKEAVLEYLKKESPEVRFTGAANTLIVKDNDYLEGWNTDGIGFHRHLITDLRFEPAGKAVVILGAGGAAKAVTDQLARQGVKTIAIFDVDKEKSTKLTAKLAQEFPAVHCRCADALEDIDLRDTDMLVNATPVGMKKDDPCLIAADKLHSGLLVYDLIYNPAETELLRRARAKGATASNGLGMLLYQGARSFELWTGKDAPVELMRQALEEGVKKL
ncbi:MAG TPA: shikimate dehydrogenase [Patescibacteria group bacterium]|nr:shikimate dehydrogenase [Patescibacteria group bacterium]